MGPKVLHVERDRTLNLMATSYSIFWKYIWYWTKISSSWTLGSVSYLDENLKPPDASSVPLLFPTTLATRVSLIKLILTKFQKKIIAQKYFISLLVFFPPNCHTHKFGWDCIWKDLKYHRYCLNQSQRQLTSVRLYKCCKKPLLVWLWSLSDTPS